MAGPTRPAPVAVLDRDLVLDALTVLDPAAVFDPGPAFERGVRIATPPGAARTHRAASSPAAVPRVLFETLAWVLFAGVIATVVIAAGDASLGRAALWSAGMAGIVLAAVVILALTGTRLENLNRPVRGPEVPD